MYHSGQTGLQIFLSVLECSHFGAYKSLTGSIETDSKRENCAYKTRAGKKQPRRKEREKRLHHRLLSAPFHSRQLRLIL